MSNEKQATSVESFSVIIVGGGPAGMHAALALTGAGRKVAIIDDAADLGGQFYRRRSQAVRARFGDVRPRGTRLAAAVKKTDAHLHLQHTVWSVSQEGVVRCFDQVSGVLRILVADHVIVATGAREEGLPFLGWTSPQVITPGHAMHLAVIDKVAPAKRMVVAGDGPFLLAVAAHLAREGVQVDGVVFASRPFALRRAHLEMLRFPRTLLQAAGYLAVLLRHRVPLISAHGVTSVAARGGSLAVNLRSSRGGTRTLDTELLAYATSFKPNDELHVLASAVQDSHGGPDVDDPRESPTACASKVVAAGDAQGVVGRQAAELRGEIAALRILLSSGEDSGHRQRLRKLERKMASFRRYGELQELLFAPARGVEAEIPDEAVVCRCECVKAGEIRTAAALGWNDRNAVKGQTRAGMGLCQGRECAHTVTKIVSEVTGRPVSLQPARVPAKPLPIAALLKEADRS